MVKKDIKEKSDRNTEEKILAAAKKVLFSKGYAGARMQDIADEAGINKALLHYYFRSKDKLFEMIFKEAIGKLMPQISSIFSDPAISFYDKVRAFCSSYIGTWLEHPYIPMFVLHELHSNSGKDFLKLVDDPKFNPIHQILGAIDAAVRRKEIRPVDPRHLLLNMISLCIFPFMGGPVFKKAVKLTDRQFDSMLRQRADEVSEFIVESIKYRK